MIPLNPLSPDTTKEIPKFAVFDIESRDWIDPLMIGLAYKLYDDDDKCIKKFYTYFEDIGEFCSYIFEDEQPMDTFFAHFGGRFDFQFLIDEMFDDVEKYYIHEMIPRGAGLLCMSVSTFERTKKPLKKDVVLKEVENGYFLVEKRKIVFRDSGAMLPFSLKNLTKDFDVEHKKMDIDHTQVTKLTPELLKYAEWDHWGLYEVLEHYCRWPIIRGSGIKFTMASQAIQVLRTYINKPIPSISGEVDQFVRSSYFGGRTEIFRPFFEQSRDDGILRSFDVTSLYPFVMRENEYPTKFDFETTFYLENRMGFYDVEVDVPEMYVPPLGIKYEGMDDRLIFPTGRFRSVWSTLELNYAMTLGVKIVRIYRGMIFKSGGFIFKDFINSLYGIRQASKKASVDNVLCKLLMNSCYGRFALNLDRENIVFDHGQMGIIPHWDIESRKNPGHIIRLGLEENYLDSSFANSAVAAWVTSAARIHMHKLYIQAEDELYYTDTDSIKSTHKYLQDNDGLGGLKYEGGVKRAVYLLPKTYIEETLVPIYNMYDRKGRIIKGKKTCVHRVMKGFSSPTIGGITLEHFRTALEGDLSMMKAENPKKFAPLRTAASRGKFLELLAESPRQLRTKYHKRRIFKGGSQVYDTEPLHIKNGDIMNMDKDILKKWKMPDLSQMEQIERRVFREMGLSVNT